MNTNFDDAVFDFDLNFFQQPVQNVVIESKTDKQRKAVLIAKKKTIATNSLIKKYYEKKETLEKTQQLLFAANEECKKVCIDYKNTLEKCTILEKDILNLKNRYEELEAQYIFSQNQHEAMKSHANQLQSLVKENELRIASLKVEKQLLEKVSGSEKKDSTLLKQNETLLSHIYILKDIVLGKKKLQKSHKLLLRKYNNATKEEKNEGCDNDISSGDETDYSDTCPLSPLDTCLENSIEPKNLQDKTHDIFKKLKNEVNIVKDNNEINEFDHDSDGGIVSEDTGRGSSLAFSDSGKFFNSPDYFSNDSPHETDQKIPKRPNRKLVDASTSPSRFYEVYDKATSPLMFDDITLLNGSSEKQVDNPIVNTPEYLLTDIPLSNEIITIKEKPKLVDCATNTYWEISPLNVNDRATSPLKFDEFAFSYLSPSNLVDNSKYIVTSEIFGTNSVTTKQKPKLVDCGTNTEWKIGPQNSNEIILSSQMFDDVRLLSDNPETIVSQINVDSPEYMIRDMSLSTKIELTREKPNVVDCGTNTNSETNSSDICDKATSPLIFDDVALLSDNTGLTTNKQQGVCPEYIITDIPISTDVITLKEKPKLIDCGTNTIREMPRVHIATSPILFTTNMLSEIPDCATEPNKISHHFNNLIHDHNTLIKSNNNEKILETTITTQNLTQTITSPDLTTQSEIEICGTSGLEKSCLEKHNSINLSEDCNDSEIEMILSTMRLDHKLLTPIPHTPSRSKTHQNSSQSSHSIKPPNNHIINHSKCSESSKLRKENKVLQENIANLSKEVFSIKCLLQQHFTPGSISSQHIKEAVQIDLINCNNIVKSVNTGMKSRVNLTINSDESLNSEKTEMENETQNKNVSNENVVNNRLNISSESENQHADDFDVELLPDIVANNSEENWESGGIVPGTEAVNGLKNQNNVENNSDLFEDITYTSKKGKKLSKLQKFKNKMLPKYKIMSDHVLDSKVSRKIPKSVVKKMSFAEISFSKNKSAYEKAVQVMADIKTKEEKKISEKHNVLRSTEDKLKNNISQIENNVQHAQEPKKIDIDNISTIQDNPSKTNSSNIAKVMDKNILTTKTNVSNKYNLCEREERINNKLVSSPLGNEIVKLLTNDSSKLNNTNSRTTRSQNKVLDNNDAIFTSPTKLGINTEKNTDSTDKDINTDAISTKTSTESRKRLKRAASDIIASPSKRILRSSRVKDGHAECNNSEILQDEVNSVNDIQESTSIVNIELKQLENNNINNNEEKINDVRCNQVKNYDDLNMFSTASENTFKENSQSKTNNYPKNSILCRIIDKFGKKTGHIKSNKITEQASSAICKKLESDIAHIIELPAEKSKTAMNKLVEDIQKYDLKCFIVGFMKYLKDPIRKQEMFKKINTPPAPSMTKTEQILLYIINQMATENPDVVNIVLMNIEFSLFQLNRTPDFDVVDTLSHFYALVCRYFRMKNRLRLFLLDAMYCLSFKVVPVVKHCLDVWMHILPLAHMGIAKSPLVTCLVYLLHFYKCEDKFNRIQEIRSVLTRKYFYKITNWNEMKILDMFRNAVKDVKENPIEKKILRMALIILAKRQGAQWCQKNIIKNLLLPVMERADASAAARRFSASVLGPLLKPYPTEMKVHCEIVVNQLLDMLEQNPPDAMKEAIFTSLIYMNKHNQFRVTQALLMWEPKQVSLEFELLIKDFVREKPVKMWTKLLPKMLTEQPG